MLSSLLGCLHPWPQQKRPERPSSLLPPISAVQQNWTIMQHATAQAGLHSCRGAGPFATAQQVNTQHCTLGTNCLSAQHLAVPITAHSNRQTLKILVSQLPFQPCPALPQAAANSPPLLLPPPLLLLVQHCSIRRATRQQSIRQSAALDNQSTDSSATEANRGSQQPVLQGVPVIDAEGFLVQVPTVLSG